MVATFSMFPIAATEETNKVPRTFGLLLRDVELRSVCRASPMVELFGPVFLTTVAISFSNTIFAFGSSIQSLAKPQKSRFKDVVLLQDQASSTFDSATKYLNWNCLRTVRRLRSSFVVNSLPLPRPMVAMQFVSP